jgi:SAM-dependent methyltransferase
MAVFEQYARYYDLLYRDKNYRAEVDFILSLLATHSPGVNDIFEMGCGTGIHAQMLAEAGHRTHGIDLSPNMLVAANARRDLLASDLRSRLTFDCGDVRSYRMNRSFDVVLSLFHVFSYQTSNADLHAAFSTASAHLAPGGVLVFDYWYGPAVLTQRPETRVKRLQDGDLSILRIAESTMDDFRSVVQVDYETIVTLAGIPETIRESHRMRYLFVPEIELLAQEHGFEPIAHQEWQSQAQPSTSSWAVCSVLRKK